ncbi:MAG: class I SAM-dependent methyltransferase [Calditrichia bacterium]
MNDLNWRRFLFPGGKVPPLLMAKDTAPLDQLHAGGLKASLRLAEQAAFSAGELVLDLGAGFGGSARLLAENSRCRVICLDVQRRYLKTAAEIFQARKLPHLGFVQSSAARLPFHSESMDGIWIQHLLGSVPNSFSVIREASRLLKPGGKMVLHECLAGGAVDGPINYPLPFANTAEQNYAPGYKQLFQRMVDLGLRQSYFQETSEEMAAWYQCRREKLLELSDDIHHPIYGKEFLDMLQNMAAALGNGSLTIWETVWTKHR